MKYSTINLFTKNVCDVLTYRE